MITKTWLENGLLNVGKIKLLCKSFKHAQHVYRYTTEEHDKHCVILTSCINPNDCLPKLNTGWNQELIPSWQRAKPNNHALWQCYGTVNFAMIYGEVHLAMKPKWKLIVLCMFKRENVWGCRLFVNPIFLRCQNLGSNTWARNSFCLHVV